MSDLYALKSVTIIIPCRNEEKYIAQCLDSIIASDYPQDTLEILVMDGQSEDNTRQLVQQYTRQYSFIRLIDNPQKTVPYAMNLGVKAAKGSFIIRLDAHSSYPSNYFTKLIQWHDKLQADNVGAVWITDVLYKTRTSIAIKLVCSDKLGVGNSLFRVGVEEVMEVDTVPFGCYRRAVFEKYGLYDERLTRNQDIEFNKRIKNRGGKIYLVPDITCTYYARETYKALAKNNFANGLWNILTAYYTKSLKSLSLRHFVPFLFVLSLCLPILGIFVFSPLIWITFTAFILYVIAVSVRSAQLDRRDTTILHVIVAFFTLHFSYGLGSLIGILNIFRLRKLK
jgi:glycosyltransferase involved in cell wall biosynthesis